MLRSRLIPAVTLRPATKIGVGARHALGYANYDGELSSVDSIVEAHRVYLALLVEQSVMVDTFYVINRGRNMNHQALA